MKNTGVTSATATGGGGVVPLIAFFALFGMASNAQGTFQIGIGTKGYERGSAIRQLSSGDFIIGGYTESYGLQETDMLLMRTDASGNVLWSSTYGGTEREVINDVEQSPDGGILAVAEKYQPNKKEGEFLTMLKTDGSGTLLWKKIFDEGGNETEGFSMAATPDGNFIVTGLVKSMNIVSDAFFTMRGEDQSLFLIKVDGSGNKVWSRRLQTSASEITTGLSVIVASDGSYVVTGNITKKGATDKKIEKPLASLNPDDERNLLLAKVSPDGTLQWANEFAAGRVTAGFSVIEKIGGGFIIAGISTDPANKSNVDYLLISTDANGTLQWSKTYGTPGYESSTDVKQAADGGYYVTGITRNFDNDIGDLMMLKTDNAGTLQWAKIYGDKNGEYGGNFVLTSDGIVLTGEASIGMESFDVLLLKTDWNGKSGCWGKDVTLKENDGKVSYTKMSEAKTVTIERGVTPPNFKRVDVNNITGQGRETRVLKICGE